MIEDLHVRGFATLLPFETLADFPEGAPRPLPKPDLGLLSPSLRRGLSDVTRMFMHTSQAALQHAGLPADRVHVVFASAFGEIAAAEQLIGQAYEQDASSPARFRNSVHNTAAGLLSISTQNVLPGTAIAAGWDTVAMGLLEASSLLSAGAEHVLLVFAEERVPEALSSEHQHGALSAALVLSLARQGSRGVIRNLRRSAAVQEPSPFRGQNHPLGPCVPLCAALAEERRTTLVVGDGQAAWCVDVLPANASV